MTTVVWRLHNDTQIGFSDVFATTITTITYEATVEDVTIVQFNSYYIQIVSETLNRFESNKRKFDANVRTVTINETTRL